MLLVDAFVGESMVRRVDSLTMGKRVSLAFRVEALWGRIAMRVLISWWCIGVMCVVGCVLVFN